MWFRENINLWQTMLQTIPKLKIIRKNILKKQLFDNYCPNRAAISCFLAAIHVLFAVSDDSAYPIIPKLKNSGTYLLA